MQKVKGTQSQVDAVEIGKDTVYIRSNIVSISEEDFTGWEYDEVQMTKDEYIKYLSDSSQLNESAILELAELIGGML